MLCRLMPSVEALCSSAEVVGGTRPATPSDDQHQVKANDRPVVLRGSGAISVSLSRRSVTSAKRSSEPMVISAISLAMAASASAKGRGIVHPVADHDNGMALHLLLPDKVCLIPGQHLGIAGIHAHQHHRVLRPAVYLYLGHTLYRAQAVFQQTPPPAASYGRSTGAPATARGSHGE